ncbi:MAG: hypothetical protein HY720_26845 [Planctomycetes bacterium]|nr:hypothetical protein [Planctomycetota bacterium]
MNQIFHLDVFLEHLDRVEESTRAFGTKTEDEAKRREANRAYNGILDALDAIKGYRTLVARNLLRLDAERRAAVAEIETQQADFQYDEEANPFRPFWTRPWAFFLNVGLFPLRLAGWLFRIRVRRERDVLERIQELQKKREALVQARESSAAGEEVARLAGEVETAERAVRGLLEKRANPRLAELEKLDLPAPTAGPAPAAGAGADEGPTIFERTREAIGRLRSLHERRQDGLAEIGQRRRIVAMLPKASQAETVLEETVAIYRTAVHLVDLLVEENQLSRTLATTLEQAAKRMEEIFPHVSEKALASWIHDEESRDLLASAREVLATLSLLTGRKISANFEVPPPRGTLPALLADRALVVRARETRRERWRKAGENPGVPTAREARSLGRSLEILALRTARVRERVAGEPERAGRLFASLRHHLGTVTYNVRSPWRAYRQHMDKVRWERRLTSGLLFVIVAWTIGALIAHAIGVLVALWAVTGNAFHWTLYLWTRSRARKLRAQTEKILREFAEEIEAMGEGRIVPGEERADHLLETGKKRAAPETAAPPAGIEGGVGAYLASCHEIHVSHMTFASTLLFEKATAREMMKGLEGLEKRVEDELRAIRLSLEDLEKSLEAEAAFYHRAARTALEASGRQEPDRGRLALSLARLREGMLHSGLDAAALAPLLDAAAAEPGEKRLFRKTPDVGKLADLAWRAVRMIEAASDGAARDKVSFAVDAMAKKDYARAEANLG